MGIRVEVTAGRTGCQNSFSSRMDGPPWPPIQTNLQFAVLAQCGRAVIDYLESTVRRRLAHAWRRIVWAFRDRAASCYTRPRCLVDSASAISGTTLTGLPTSW